MKFIIILLICIIAIAISYNNYYSKSIRTNANRKCNRLVKLQHYSNNQFVENEKLIIKSLLNGMRASNIKKILTNNQISTLGLYDKSELINTLLKYEEIQLLNCEYYKLTKLSFQNDPMKIYYGLEFIINNEKMKFILDSGATISLINKESVIKKLKLPLTSNLLYTESLSSNSNQVQQPISNNKVTIPNINFMNKQFSLEMIVLDNPRMLPIVCDGLLGLNFIQSLQSDILIDFKNEYIKCSKSMQSLIPLSIIQDFELISSINTITNQIQHSGLAIVNAYLPTNSIKSKNNNNNNNCNTITIPCDAMIDMGSLYTIANSLAIDTIYSLEKKTIYDLLITSTIAAGIDGKPLPLRYLPIPYIQLG